MSASHWYYQSMGTAIGPLTGSELKRHAGEGRLTHDTLIRKGDGGKWVQADKVQGLFDDVRRASQHIPPTPPQQVVPVEAPPVQPTRSMIDSAATRTFAATDEALLWSDSPSQITNLGVFIICGLTFWLIVPIFVALWAYLQVKYSSYELTNQRFRLTYGVLSRRTDELELYRVKDSSFVQPFFLRIFSLANVIMTTSDISTPMVAINAIPAAEAKDLRETIRLHVERLRASKRVREVDVI